MGLFETAKPSKADEMLTFPHLNGHYNFRGNGQIIDLDAVIADLILE